MENSDPFLVELQKQCLTDAVDEVAVMQEALLRMEKAPLEVISTLLKICHNYKGNLQAVAFKNCSEFIHQFETSLQKIEAKIKGAPGGASSDDLRFLEFMLSDAMVQIQTYFTALLSSLVDDPDLMAKRKYVFPTLDGWEVSVTTTEVPTAAPSTPEPIKIASEPAKIAPPPAAPVQPLIESGNPPVSLQTEKAPAKQIVAVETPEPEENRNAIYLLCRNGNLAFALDVQKVVEVVQLSDVNQMPCAQQALVGLMNLRGEVVPVLRLKEMNYRETSHRLAVICKNTVGKFGLPVDAADCVVEYDKRKFQSAVSALGENSSGLIENIYLDQGHPILILSLDKAFAA